MPRPSRAQLQEELDRLASIVRGARDGISRSALGDSYAERFGVHLDSRTLQRRLAQLAALGDIEPRRRGAATAYFPTGRTTPAPFAIREDYPPLSAEATKIRSLVRQPISRRVPVGYEPDWLYSYKPGRSWYLPKRVRAHLNDLGVTPDQSRPAGTFARDILDRLLIDLAWASSRLEGNTYTRLDTQNLLEFGQRAEGKDATEAQMILNHKAAIELLVSDADDIGFNSRTLSALHAALSGNLLGDPADEGRLRERPVLITGTTYIPTAIPQVIRECFTRILELEREIPDPYEQAFFAMVHIPYLQPFVDVNKRTSRLAANIPLVVRNLCPLSFVDVPPDAYLEGTIAVYEQRRIELLRDVFVFAYERSCARYKVVRESLGQPDPIRLRYHAQLTDAVTRLVRSGTAPSHEAMRSFGEELGVAPADLAVFGETALRIVLGLNEGSAARYRLTPQEFEEWRAKFAIA